MREHVRHAQRESDTDACLIRDRKSPRPRPLQRARPCAPRQPRASPAAERPTAPGGRPPEAASDRGGGGERSGGGYRSEGGGYRSDRGDRGDRGAAATRAGAGTRPSSSGRSASSASRRRRSTTRMPGGSSASRANGERSCPAASRAPARSTSGSSPPPSSGRAASLSCRTSAGRRRKGRPVVGEQCGRHPGARGCSRCSSSPSLPSSCTISESGSSSS